MSEYEDKAAIAEVLNLYAFALDSHAWDLFPLIFTEDVIAEFGPASAEWKTLDDLASEFELFHETLDNHAHQMMGPVIHVEGDTAYTLMYGQWLLARNDAEGGPVWVGTGWYDDEFVRTDAGWRIRHRIARQIAFTGNPGVLQPVGDQTPNHTPNSLRQAREAGEIRYFNAISAK